MQLQLQHHYKITDYAKEIPPAFRQKMLSLSILPSSSFQVMRVAPLDEQIACRYILKRQANVLIG